mmetsp:Transcript_6579/g.14978  ORF Transcript_6579/g.14978 Transcript_6579/m.14978 type:complete len:355 (+) Transcript_6579:66-1130(+)
MPTHIACGILAPFSHLRAHNLVARSPRERSKTSHTTCYSKERIQARLHSLRRRGNQRLVREIPRAIARTVTATTIFEFNRKADPKSLRSTVRRGNAHGSHLVHLHGKRRRQSSLHQPLHHRSFHLKRRRLDSAEIHRIVRSTSRSQVAAGKHLNSIAVPSELLLARHIGEHGTFDRTSRERWHARIVAIKVATPGSDEQISRRTKRRRSNGNLADGWCVRSRARVVVRNDIPVSEKQHDVTSDVWAVEARRRHGRVDVAAHVPAAKFGPSAVLDDRTIPSDTAHQPKAVLRAARFSRGREASQAAPVHPATARHLKCPSGSPRGDERRHAPEECGVRLAHELCECCRLRRSVEC